MKCRSNWSWIALIVLGALVVSCAAPPPASEPTAAPSPIALPQATSGPATSAAAPATAAPSATSQLATATSAPTVTSRPPTASPTSRPTVPSATATASPTPATISTSGQSTKVDLNAFLPPGKGQTLLLNNCTSCHSFVCAVQGQRSVDYWQTIKNGHRERVSSMSDDDYDALFSYLAENFNDKKPVPELPSALQDLGCSAQ